MTIRLVLLDVADTLLHKPGLWPALAAELARAGLPVTDAQILRAHRATRDLLPAPDRTGRDFYLEFNARFLEALGVRPRPDLPERIYLACRDLPWEPFADTAFLPALGRPTGIVSNWDRTLRQRLAALIPQPFEPIVISAEVGVAKPDPEIFVEAVRQAGLAPHEILHVGDSVALDMIPAGQAGLRTVLVDRDGQHPGYPGARIFSLGQLPSWLTETDEKN